jgi:hypothetical protein
MTRTAGILLAMLALSACHKRGFDAEDAASSRGLQVEAYDPVIPKAPVKGKLETMASHPEDAGASTASSKEAEAASSGPPER